MKLPVRVYYVYYITDITYGKFYSKITKYGILYFMVKKLCLPPVLAFNNTVTRNRLNYLDR